MNLTSLSPQEALLRWLCLPPPPAGCSCAGEGSTAPSSSCRLHRRLQAHLVAKQSPRNRHTRGLVLCWRQQPADRRLGELRRNRELPSLVSQVLTATTPAAAVTESLVTSKSLCSAGKHLSHLSGGNLQLRQPCWSQSELSPRNRFPSAARSLLLWSYGKPTWTQTCATCCG